LAPIKNEERLEFDVRGRTLSIEKLYLYIRNQEHLDQLRAPYETSKLLFNHLESMYLSDLIEELRVSGKHESGETISISQLSEGEQQLVTVFGLLLFTQQDETLYLLDEPDSHLNPRWVYDYLEMLRRAFLSGEKVPGEVRENPLLDSTEPTVPGASQVILATHNPIMIGSLRREQVRLMSQGKERTEAEPPSFDPIGVGVEGLMKSELFDLRSTLAPEILAKLDKHYLLLGKPNKTEDEQQELMQLNDELNELAVARTHPNPYFERFAVAMAKRIPKTEVVLTKEELEAQAKLADEILAEIIAEERAEKAKL
jgi:predicted ATPase